MGEKTIWDGEDLPPIGCEVLVHLASAKAWVRHVVSGYRVNRYDQYSYRVNISLKLGNTSNERSLQQCFPLDTDPLDLPVGGCLKTPHQMAEKVS